MSHKHKNTGVPTVVLADIPPRVEAMKPLLEAQGYRVIPVALIQNGTQEVFADYCEAQAAAGPAKGVTFRARVHGEHDVKALWDMLRHDEQHMDGKIRAVIVGHTPTVPHVPGRVGYFDELIARGRPAHTLPAARLAVTFSGTRHNAKPHAQLAEDIGRYKGQPQLLPFSLLDETGPIPQLHPQALATLDALAGKSGSSLPPLGG